MASLTSPDLSRATPTHSRHQCVLIDSHVHIYTCFDIDTFLASAWHNFRDQAARVGSEDRFTGVLLLTESKQHDWFQTLAARSGESVSSCWRFFTTAEPYSLKAVDDLGRTLYLIAGRQVVTAEKLEVLALICDRTFPDGLSTEATIADIQAAGGIAVLPWGVGKWVGKRGQLIAQLLQQQRPFPLFLGDNSGRPQFWKQPPYFSQSQQPVLPGTDPLPLAAEVQRPGKFGLMLVGEFDDKTPGSALKAHLLNPSGGLQPYGHLENPWTFVRNQAALRLTSSPTPAASPPMETSPALGTFPETADIETASEDYATRFAGATGQWLLQVQETATLTMLKAYPQAKVLDVGGGHGQITKALIDAGYDVTVLGSAEECKNRIQTYVGKGQCAFQAGNVLDMPYPDNAFDVVISYRFLAHVTQWQRFLKELTRVASQAVMVDYPTVRSVNAIAPALFKFKKGLEGNTRPFICYQEKDITSFCQSLGWVQRQRYAQFFWPMVLHRTLGKPQVSSGLELMPRIAGLTRLLGSPVIAQFQKT